MIFPPFYFSLTYTLVMVVEWYSLIPGIWYPHLDHVLLVSNLKHIKWLKKQVDKQNVYDFVMILSHTTQFKLASSWPITVGKFFKLWFQISGQCSPLNYSLVEKNNVRYTLYCLDEPKLRLVIVIKSM